MKKGGLRNIQVIVVYQNSHCKLAKLDLAAKNIKPK
jgi:hypothetical protein